MKLDPAKYRRALEQLGPERAQFIVPPTSFAKWLVDHAIPKEIATTLLENSFGNNLPWPNGCGGMWPVQDIVGLNDQEASLLAAGLLAVGSAINGDFIVLDLLDPDHRAGFVSHDELWEHPPQDARTIYLPVADSLDEMLFGISRALRECMANEEIDEPSYPIDGNDAYDWLHRKQD